ncbi:uncharacterized protein B0T15DRAFT_511199 [Chaetomium strumarium]|uniref:Uncharacterized protein n=1 Tax=Chaetomium strumarium TaxID=1170767 RepID=A0AAJ0M1A4_9PEZI|nr:hypothetical protein B0T15DRAFT_511199 [Chaetomium strumarium]
MAFGMVLYSLLKCCMWQLDLIIMGPLPTAQSCRRGIHCEPSGTTNLDLLGELTRGEGNSNDGARMLRTNSELSVYFYAAPRYIPHGWLLKTVVNGDNHRRRPLWGGSPARRLVQWVCGREGFPRSGAPGASDSSLTLASSFNLGEDERGEFEQVAVLGWPLQVSKLPRRDVVLRDLVAGAKGLRHGRRNRDGKQNAKPQASGEPRSSPWRERRVLAIHYEPATHGSVDADSPRVVYTG